MPFIYPFPSQLPAESTELPATLISLDEWALVTVTGQDSRQYLQGQFTCDVNTLTASHWAYSAHCDAKGKVLGAFCLFATDNLHFTYLPRRSTCEKQLAELKKYAVFSKVTIAVDEQRVLLGLAGANCRECLELLYPQLPDKACPAIHLPEYTLLHLEQPTERFIIIASAAEATRIFNALLGKVALNDSQQWLTLDIEAGIPVIDTANYQVFIPQAINLQAINAISFTKGCYLGQETIARAHYRGANKRAMYWLSGRSWQAPQLGSALEIQLSENWRQTGTILSCILMNTDEYWLQVVLNNDTNTDMQLRFTNEEGTHLTFHPLPYSLDE